MEEQPSHPAFALLARAQPQELAAAAFKDKVQHRPLILRPTSPDPLSKDARSARRRERLHKKSYQLRKQKPRRLSAKERRKLGVHDIPKAPELRKWELYKPLRLMWWKYLQELLGIDPTAPNQDRRYVTGAAVGPRLAAADYHGAELEVVRSNCTSRVGVRGIVLKDTKFTFELITESNEVKTIPKKQTTFRFEVPRTNVGPLPTEPDAAATEVAPGENYPMPLVFELRGEHFEVRAADRANKKFKPKRMDDL